MATLTGVTGNTAEVSTQLKAVFSNLMAPTTAMQGVIEKNTVTLQARRCLKAKDWQVC
nr:hypothetical protein [Blautia producta]